MAVIFYADIFNRDRRTDADAKGAREEGFSLEGDNGCTVMLVHGLTGTPYEMRYVANALNKKGYSIVCPRLANHGKPLRVLKRTKWQDFYDSVRRSFLEEAQRGGQVFVAGLSMGALLTLLLADEFKERIAGISCLSPTLFYDGWNTPWQRHLLMLGYRTPLKHFFYVKEDPPYGIKNEELRKIIHRFYSKARINSMNGVAEYGYPYISVDLLYQLHLLVKYLKTRLPRIKTPVQLIQAKDDDMTSVKNSQLVYDNIGSRIKELIFLYNSYHVITADQERDTVVQKMEDFISGLRAKETQPALETLKR